MFLGEGDLNVQILTVFEMAWDRVDAKADFRPFHSLTLRLEGGATIFAEGKPPLSAREGDILFTPAKYDFSKQADRGRIIAIHFTADREIPGEFLRHTPRNLPYFQREFGELLRVWTKKERGYQYESKVHFYRILLAIEREMAQDSPSPSEEKLRAACGYIHEHFTEGGLSVEQLARMSGMSDTYLRRLFVEHYGVTPLQYINRLRLTMATELLRAGKYTAGEIAAQCGFTTQNYFSFFIKKETGLSPVDYRRKLLTESRPAE